MDHHYHVWVYERDGDGTINTLRRRGETYQKRRQAIYALQKFRFWPGMGTTYTPGQVLACDDGPFCKPHVEGLAGYTIAGPTVIPITDVIDGQTKSLRPAKKEIIANQAISKWVENGDAKVVDEF